MLIDSHCHPNSDELRKDAEALMERAASAGVGRMLIVGCDLEDSREAVRMAHRFEGYGAWAAVGIHPHEASRYAEALPEELLQMAEDCRTLALGEMGLDYHYDLSPRKVQREVFQRQLAWAEGVGMPVVLHVREAMEDALIILRDFRGLKLLFHCYDGGLKFLDEVLNLGALCALGGAVTWKRSVELREVARLIPADRLLAETDCPWMAPVPFRGRLNEPAYVRYVYEALAEVRGVPLEELSGQIARNADGFFGWGREAHV